MSAIERISDIGTIITLLGLIGVSTAMIAMSNNIGNPDYPMLEVGMSAIKATLLLLIPTGILGYIFFAADALS